MRVLLLFLALFSTCFSPETIRAGNFDVKGNAGFEYKSYLQKQQSKRDYNLATIGELGTSYRDESFTAKILIDALWDTDEDERNYLRANEVFIQYDFERFRSALGRRVIFWGALEVYNSADVVNTRDLARDPFDVFKIGAYVAELSAYFEESQLDLLIKFYEEDQKFPDEDSPYNVFQGLPYDDDLLTEESRTRPTVFLKYSGSTETEWALDYALVLSNGYDNQRFFSLDSSGNVRQNAYIATRVMTFDTLVVGSTLLKCEASFTDVKDNSLVSDYYQAGLGVEHTLEHFFKGTDLGLLVEYYYYELTDNEKFHDDLTLLQPYQHDLFFGFRWTFNDEASTEIVSGGIFDLQHKNDASYYVQYKTRLFDTIVVDADIRKITATTEEVNTLYKQLDDHTRISLSARYYF